MLSLCFNYFFIDSLFRVNSFSVFVYARMAATMHAKMNRRNLNQIDLIRICEEILNPRAPMALRLSSILMGGVVIVYERKVKLLFDDVHRLLDQLNEAWKKVKSNTDSTILPKRRAQAKKEAITLPEAEHEDTDLVGDIEQSLDFSHHATLFHQQTGYFLMQLDSVDVGETLNDNAVEGDQHQNLHQADPEDITLPKCYDPSDAHADLFNCRFERFEIEGDDVDLTSGEPTHIRPPSPNYLIPSPPRQDQHQERQQANNVFDEVLQMQDVQENAQQRQRPIRRRKRKTPASVMDNDQQSILLMLEELSILMYIPCTVLILFSLLQPKNIMSTMKIGKLMEQPASVLMGRLFKPGSGETYYPAPLLELFKEKHTHDSPSALTSPPLPPEPSSWSPPEKQTYHDPWRWLPVICNPTEQIRTNLVNNDVTLQPELMDKLKANPNGMKGADTNPATPRNSGDERRSILSSSSGKGVNRNSSEVNSGRKRRYSSIHSNDGLEPVLEDNGCQHSDPNFNVIRLSGNGPTPEHELLMETGPTQTQQPIINQPLEKVTDAIRMELKSHFEIPGGPQVESLNKLTAGMNRRGAAMLFYQTCVLATRDFVKVKQIAPYEDVLITRGPNM
ncbi:sister chromatid cohesion 1 protein 1-like [Rosa chinensis]|uniref:sister chromatid cohesion 1 protein 1-like n=1 Tax=Rosa chinensis TaxID=74649 RepID=UPI001AD8AC3A|nr:sister chromatid cohesion 1 protein 1-like [Rosa chinensis]